MSSIPLSFMTLTHGTWRVSSVICILFQEITSSCLVYSWTAMTLNPLYNSGWHVGLKDFLVLSTFCLGTYFILCCLFSKCYDTASHHGMLAKSWKQWIYYPFYGTSWCDHQYGWDSSVPSHSSSICINFEWNTPGTISDICAWVSRNLWGTNSKM